MRRFMTVALVGLALSSAVTVASAQGRGQRRPPPGAGQSGRGGVMDTARARRLDSLRVARGDSGRRHAPDSLRARRLDSLRAAGGPDGRRGGPGGRRGGPADVVGARFALAGITLTDAQRTSLKTINQKYGEELRALRQGSGDKGVGQNPELRTRIDAIAARQRAEIRATLTAQQQTQFDANVAKGRGGRGRGGPPPRRPPAGAR